MQNAAASPLLPPAARARVMNLFITDLTHAASKRHISHKSTVVRASAPPAAATAQRSALPLPPLTSLPSAPPLLHRNHQAAPNTFFHRAVDCAGFVAGSWQTWQRKRGFPAQRSRMCRNGGCHAASTSPAPLQATQPALLFRHLRRTHERAAVEPSARAFRRRLRRRACCTRHPPPRCLPASQRVKTNPHSFFWRESTWRHHGRVTCRFSAERRADVSIFCSFVA